MLPEDKIFQILDIAKHAGQYLKEHFLFTHKIESKSHINDLVTECDRTSEDMIKEALKKNFEGCGFLCEESGQDNLNSPYTFIIDPLDGTVNFAKQIPFFAVNIALKKQNDIIFSTTYSPMTSELFYALKGKGAYLNNHQIFVSKQKELSKAFGATGFPYKVQENVKASLKPIENLLKKGVPLRRLGSAALDLAYIAAGRFDIFFESYLEPWDYASGLLLVKEAGGTISDFQNNPLPVTKSSNVLATNTYLHTAMYHEVTY
jgi:myo-inositol-1(or 4)-monophosphatase